MAPAAIPALRAKRTARVTLNLADVVRDDTEMAARLQGRTVSDFIAHLLHLELYGLAAMLPGLQGGENPQPAADRGNVYPLRRKG